MSLEDLYNKFRMWLDKEQRHWQLRSDAPKEAVEAYNEYFKIKKDTKGRIVD